MDWLHWSLIIAFCSGGFFYLLTILAMNREIDKRGEMVLILVNRLNRHGEEVSLPFLEVAALTRLDQGYGNERSDQPVAE